MNMLYHGSATPDIRVLRPQPNPRYVGRPGVYLTGNLPYALLYIWDAEKLGTTAKHVTAGIKNGIVYYEEQFPNQLEAFYKGTSGWLYHIIPPENAQPVKNREEMFLCPGEVPVDHARHIPDVYAALLQWEAAGKLTVLRFDARSPERQTALTGIMAQAIREAAFYQQAPDQADFYRRYYPAAWALARTEKQDGRP